MRRTKAPQGKEKEAYRVLAMVCPDVSVPARSIIRLSQSSALLSSSLHTCAFGQEKSVTPR